MEKSSLRFLKPLIIVLVGLFLAVLLISSLMPSRLVMVNSITINKSKDSVFASIKDLQKWRVWHPYFKNNSTSVEFSSNRIRMNKRGDTGMLLSSSNDAQYSCSIVFYQKGKNDYQYNFQLYDEPGKSGTEVHWEVRTHLRWYPWEKFSGIFFKQMAAPSYEEALASLRQYCEQQ